MVQSIRQARADPEDGLHEAQALQHFQDSRALSLELGKSLYDGRCRCRRGRLGCSVG